MIEFHQDASRLLYHYTKSNTALDFILKNGELKFGRYSTTNDPKESKNWHFAAGTSVRGQDLSSVDFTQLSNELSARLKNQTKLLCFSKDDGPLSGDHVQDIYKRGYCKPRMWAQYADRHKGFCLVFDRNELAKKIEEQTINEYLILQGEVHYCDRIVVPNLFRDQEYMINLDVLLQVGWEEYSKLHLRTHYRRLFFEKMTDWRDEREHRYVAFSNSTNDLYLKYGSALVGIMFGEETPNEIIDATIKLTSSQPLKLMKLNWKNCSPWYDFMNPLFQKIRASN